MKGRRKTRKKIKGQVKIESEETLRRGEEPNKEAGNEVETAGRQAGFKIASIAIED